MPKSFTCSYVRRFTGIYCLVHMSNNAHVCVLVQVSMLIDELSKAASDALGITMDETLEEKLNAYTESVAHFPTKIAEVSTNN